LAGKVVTLDIDSTAIRLLEVSGGKVRKWASISHEQDKVEEEEVSNPQALGNKVKQLMASSSIRASKVISSLSGLYSVSRIVNVPNPTAGLTLQQAALEAASEVMPLSADDLYLSWRTITIDEEGQQILAVGVPRDIIDDQVRALRAAGINPHILDLKAMALARLVNREQALILNIEPSSFDIVIIVNGLPEIMRTVAWQQEELTEENKVEHLAVNLELTAGFYNSQHHNTPLDIATPLFITGQITRDFSLMEKMEARLEYPIEPLVPPLECPQNLPVSEYAVNIGLALKGMALAPNPEQGGYSPPNINLLPDVYQPWKPSAKQLYVTGLVIAAIALLFPLYQVTTNAMDETASLNREYTALNSELQQRQLELKRRVPLQEAIKEYDTIIDMGGNFTEDLAVIYDEAKELGVEVESASHEGDSITISCQAKDDDPVTFDNFVKALENTERFSKVTPPTEGFPYNTGGTIELEVKAGG